MIARTTLATILTGALLASGLGLSGRPAGAATLIRKDGSGAAMTLPRHEDLPAFVGTLDDGLAYDTPRDDPRRQARFSPGMRRAWQIGTASWYGGPQWQGRQMTDGNRYEQDKLTAAHLSLPLGSLVRVTLLGDDRSVVVRITDRPGTRRRIIDLSRAAAARLGMLSKGLAEVRLDLL